MKIRRILPLLALAVVALIALAGCDAMLESLFPNDTNQGAGNNSLTVDAHTYYYSVYNDIYYGPLTVVIMSNGAVIERNSYWLNYYGVDDMQASWTFNNLADGDYQVYVWIDYNNDGQAVGDFDYGANWGQNISLSGGQDLSASEYVYYYYENYWTSPTF